MVSLDSALTVKPDVVSRQVQGEEVILDLLSGTYFGLNEVGTKVWSLLKSKTKLAAIAKAVAEEFDVPLETAQRDLLILAETLKKKKLVTVS